MSEEKKEERSALQKAESISKIIGAVSVPIVGLIVTVILHFNSEANRIQQTQLAEKNRKQQFQIAEKNRRSQLFAEIMSKRELADSDIRASMFKTLMTEYGGLASKNYGSSDNDTIENLRGKLVFLNLLINNFQEYFNAKPLFEDLYERINEIKNKYQGKDKPQITSLKENLIKISKATAKKQEIMLSRIGMTQNVLIKKQDIKCVLLYDPFGLKKMTGNGEPEELDYESDGACSVTIGGPNQNYGEKEQESIESGKAKYAIDITLKAVHEDDVSVKITLYQDYFESGTLIFRRFVRNDMEFSISYFDLPYMDNTRLFDGSRFSLILRDVPSKDWADLGIIVFREEFMSLRDRPFLEEMLNKLQTEKL